MVKGSEMSEAAPAGEAADRPLVTHFLYAYKQEASVGAAIASVLAQTYTPLEIILSDDCSPDGTFAVMQAMAAAYDGPHTIVLNRNPTNLGIGRHAETIMAMARGDFIVESAGDDISLPHRTETLARVWIEFGRRVKYVHSEKQDVDADGTLLPLAPRRDLLAGVTPRQITAHKYGLIGATAGWDRETVDRFAPIAEVAAFHDYPLAFRAALLGEVAFLPEPLVHYGTGGVSRHKTQSYGHWYFHGDRIRYLRWDLQFHQSYRRDLDRVRLAEPEDHEAAVAACDRFIAEAAFTIALSEMTHRQRLAALPRAARASLAQRTPFYLQAAVKYLLDKPFIRYLDWKTGAPPPEAPAAGTPLAT